jgi:hypothetical protein
MGVTSLFLSQVGIDSWVAQGSVEFDGESLGEPGRDPCVDLEPAVRFVREVSGEGDPDDLVGRVRSVEEIRELGADHYRDSVIVGETAYEVVEGYIATPRKVVTEVAKTSYGNEPEPRGSEQPRPAPAAADTEKRAAEPEPEEGGGQEGSEADELARLLLEKL